MANDFLPEDDDDLELLTGLLETRTGASGSGNYTKLSVNMTDDVRDKLKKMMDEQDTSATLLTNQAIQLLHLYYEATKKKHRMAVLNRRGKITGEIVYE